MLPVCLRLVKSRVLFTLLSMGGLLLAASPASAQLTIAKTTWNVIGLDSNNVNVGPNTFPVGVRVCNTSGGDYTNVTTTLAWDTANAYVTLGNSATINRGTVAAGACGNFYYYVTITRNAAAYFTTRRYHITASADGVSSVQTPVRELYIEKLISQNRNAVISITGPAAPKLGGTYTYTLVASTATGGYEQVENPLTLDPAIFDIQSIQSTYSNGVSPVSGMYNDACSWIDDPANAAYRSCSGTGKAGNSITMNVTVKIIGTGSATLNAIIYDFSGSSYHYNSDYGGLPLSVTASTPSTDLQVTKTDGVTTVTEGGTTTYTIVATNAGPSAADGATLQDPAVAGLNVTAVSCAAGGGAVCPASVTVAGLQAGLVIPTFPSGGTITLTVSAAITGTAAVEGTIANVATITVPAGVDESNAANNTATDTDTIVVSGGTADLGITKSDGVASVAPSGTVTYSIVVSNAGPDSADNAVVTDPAATGITKTSVGCVAAGSAVCPATLTVAALEAGMTIPTLPSGGSITLSVGATVTAGNGSVTNTATVAAPPGIVDNNAGNNTASDTDTINATADLSITKTDSVAAVTAGTSTTYSIVVTNNGPSAANNATVTDAAAAGLSKVSIVCSASGGAACPTLPNIADLEAGMVIPTLPSGGSVTLTVSATVTAVSGSVTNTASVAVPAGLTDSNGGNNSASDTDTVTPSADLRVTKTDGVTSVVTGGTTTYTITATNAGPSSANGGKITDTPGAGLTLTGVSCTASGGATCPSPLTVASLLAGATVATWPNGGVVTLTVTATLGPAPMVGAGSFTNQATVSVPAGTTDPDASNNTDTDTDAIGETPAADLRVTISDGVTTVGPGDTLNYVVVASNAGPASANNSVIANPQPAGVTYQSVVCTASGGAVCPAGLTLAAWQAGVAIPTFPNGGSLTFTVVAVVTATGGSIANTATITAPAGVVDPTPGNNTATDTDTLLAQQIGVAKSVGEVLLVGASAFEVPFTITVRNTGTIRDTNVQVTDALDQSFASGSPTITITRAPSSAPTGGATAAQCAVNAAFTGTGAAVTLLAGNTDLLAGQGCVITFTAKIAYASEDKIPTTTQTNTAVARTYTSPGSGPIATDNSDSGSDPAGTNPGTPGDTGGSNDPTPVPFLVPKLTFNKSLERVSQVDGTTFDIRYKLTVRNGSQAIARNVQMTDDLSVTFAAGSPALTIVAGPSLDAGTATLTLATGASVYNGTSRPGLLSGSDVIRPGEWRDLFFTVRVVYPSVSAIPVGADIKNTARATVAATPGGAAVKTYVSDDVTSSGEKVTGTSGARATIVSLMPAARISIAKSAAADLVEVGDSMRYSIRIINSAASYLPALTLQDRPPLGFSYVRGSARMTAGTVTTALADARLANGILSFAVPAVTGVSEVTVTYRLRVGPGAMQGDGTNRAKAVLADGTATPESAARVRVTGGVFTDQACIIGKVFLDANANQLQDDDATERGVAGVTLYLEDGTSVTTDGVGQYSLCGLTSGTHVLKIDASTLPEGARPVVSSSRNALDPATQFLDLVFGDMRRADFVLEPITQTAIDPLRTALATRASQFSAGVLSVEAAPVAGVWTAGTGRAETPAPVVHNATDRLPAVPAVPATGPAPAASPAGAAAPPSPRPMVAAGVVEGIVALSSVRGPGLTPTRPNDVFETGLRKVTHLFNGDRSLVAARTAMFVQGTVSGDVLLTLSLDTERSKTGVLFRDIQPNAFYPIFGDASQKQFAAQTSGPVYLRAQRRKHYAMFGDILTSAATPARNLGVYARSLTGAKVHVEGEAGSVTTFAARDTLRQVVDELGALGVSGPYSVSNPNGVSGSEKVEIVTRDREQPALILGVRPMTRFVDYQFEPFSGRLLFTSPVPSMDERMNPVSIRVTYEVDGGGDAHWIAGAEATATLGEAVALGVSVARDDAAASPYDLASANATIKFSTNTILLAEVARSSGSVNTNPFNQAVTAALARVTGDISGTATRIEARHTADRLEATAFFGRSDARFYNPAAMLNGGRQEAGARASLSLVGRTRLLGEWMSSEDRVAGGSRTGGRLAVESRVKSALFEIGLRRVSESVLAVNPAAAGVISPFATGATAGYGFTTARGPIDPTTGRPIVSAGATPLLNSGAGARALGSPLEATTVRGQVAWRPADGRFGAYAEAERELSSSGRAMAAIGGEYRPVERGRFYLRHEFNQGLAGMYQSVDGPKTQRTVFGLSTSAPAEGDLFTEFRLNQAISGREAMAAVGLRNNWTLAKGLRLNTAVERLNPVATVGNTATALSVGGDYTRASNFKATSRVEWRRDGRTDAWLSTSGLALRLTDNWSALGQNYYQRRDVVSGTDQSQERLWVGAAYRDESRNRRNWLSRFEYRLERLPDAGGVVGLSERRVKIVSTHGDYKPSTRWQLFGHYAGKWASETGEGQTTKYAAHLVSARTGLDVTSRFDLGLLTSLMWSGSDHRTRKAIGAEIGTAVKANVWFSLGFNAVGFSDRDFNDVVSTTATTRGFFVRLRMKFDESLWGGSQR